MGAGARVVLFACGLVGLCSVGLARLAVAGVGAATIVFGGVVFFLGRPTYPTPDPMTPGVIEAPAPRPSPAPVLPSVWGRCEIFGLAVAASDALTSGKPLPDLANQDRKSTRLNSSH